MMNIGERQASRYMRASRIALPFLVKNLGCHVGTIDDEACKKVIEA
jgi:Mn-dependent DtxR family transcriptional regulator